MHCYVLRYEIIANAINSNKFTEFGTKSKNSDLKIKEPKKPKNLPFAVSNTCVIMGLKIQTPNEFAPVPIELEPSRPIPRSLIDLLPL